MKLANLGHVVAYVSERDHLRKILTGLEGKLDLNIAGLTIPSRISRRATADLVRGVEADIARVEAELKSLGVEV